VIRSQARASANSARAAWADAEPCQIWTSMTATAAEAARESTQTTNRRERSDRTRKN
jgi:hypothetical protein